MDTPRWELSRPRTIDFKRSGAILQMIRKAKNIRINVLAEASGVHQRSICQVERGRHSGVRLSTINALCDTLGVPISHVLRWEK